MSSRRAFGGDGASKPLVWPCWASIRPCLAMRQCSRRTPQIIATAYPFRRNRRWRA